MLEAGRVAATGEAVVTMAGVDTEVADTTEAMGVTVMAADITVAMEEDTMDMAAAIAAGQLG